jgi:hypothetical protein
MVSPFSRSDGEIFNSYRCCSSTDSLDLQTDRHVLLPHTTAVYRARRPLGQTRSITGIAHCPLSGSLQLDQRMCR